jgi:hypothetical protein
MSRDRKIPVEVYIRFCEDVCDDACYALDVDEEGVGWCEEFMEPIEHFLDSMTLFRCRGCKEKYGEA